MKNKPEKQRNSREVEKSIFEKLTTSRILDFQKLVSMGYIFNQEIATLNISTDLEDIDKNIIQSFVAKGVLSLNTLKALSFSITCEQMKKAGFNSEETSAMLGRGFVIVGDDMELEFTDNPVVVALEERLVTRQAIQDLSEAFPLLIAKEPEEEQ